MIWLQRIWHFLCRENLHRILLFILILIGFSSVSYWYVEPETDFLNALWWSIVTLTTVGYGDISPSTMGGRLIGAITMVLGIGVLGMFTASIAGIFIERKIREDRGMKTYDFTQHIIICQWNVRAKEIHAELRSDKRTILTPIILVAKLEAKPIDDDNLYFINGDVDEENLNKANLKGAKTVLILGDDRLEPNPRDAQVVLSTLTVETMNPNAYTIVELTNERNVRHCQNARADEIIVGSEFSSRLIARSALDHGISSVLSELISSRTGNDLYKVPLPISLHGKRFIEVFTEMKSGYNSIVLAAQKGGKAAVIANPGVDYLLERGDFLIVIADQKPAAG